MTVATLEEIEAILPTLTGSQLLRLAQKVLAQARTVVEPPQTIDWEAYRGVLRHGPDPLEYQNAVRGERD